MTQRTLILLRHGKSDWSGDEPDIARPLSRRGRLQAAEAGRWLERNHPPLDLVLCSPATRARSTWEQVAAQCDGHPFVDVDMRVYTFKHPGLLALLHEAAPEVTTTLLIGHEPALSDLIGLLTGHEVEMLTSALAVLVFDGAWHQLAPDTCALVAHGRPPT